jgi:hypothetical protein
LLNAWRQGPPDIKANAWPRAHGGTLRPHVTVRRGLAGQSGKETGIGASQESVWGQPEVTAVEK